MANRQEFSKAVRVEIIKRATRDGVIYCEGCGLPPKRFEIDHIIADATKPAEDKKRKLTAKDGQLLCKGAPACCHDIKTAEHDTPAAAKCKRVEAAHLRANPAPKKKLQSRGFEKSTKPKPDKLPLPQRDPTRFGGCFKIGDK